MKLHQFYQEFPRVVKYSKNENSAPTRAMKMICRSLIVKIISRQIIGVPYWGVFQQIPAFRIPNKIERHSLHYQTIWKNSPYFRFFIISHSIISCHIVCLPSKVINIVSPSQDSSAARNGMLTDHFITEIDGQNVVGMSDDKILKVIKSKDRTVTVTVMPEFVYDHMVRFQSFFFCNIEPTLKWQKNLDCLKFNAELNRWKFSFFSLSNSTNEVR